MIEFCLFDKEIGRELHFEERKSVVWMNGIEDDLLVELFVV